MYVYTGNDHPVLKHQKAHFLNMKEKTGEEHPDKRFVKSLFRKQGFLMCFFLWVDAAFRSKKNCHVLV